MNYEHEVKRLCPSAWVRHTEQMDMYAIMATDIKRLSVWCDFELEAWRDAYNSIHLYCKQQVSNRYPTARAVLVKNDMEPLRGYEIKVGQTIISPTRPTERDAWIGAVITKLYRG